MSEKYKYYVNENAQDNGDHEVHKGNCSRLPESKNRIYLGEFESCDPAVEKAKEHFKQVNGCYWCSRACHTQ